MKYSCNGIIVQMIKHKLVLFYIVLDIARSWNVCVQYMKTSEYRVEVGMIREHSYILLAIISNNYVMYIS